MRDEVCKWLHEAASTFSSTLRVENHTAYIFCAVVQPILIGKRSSN